MKSSKLTQFLCSKCKHDGFEIHNRKKILKCSSCHHIYPDCPPTNDQKKWEQIPALRFYGHSDKNRKTATLTISETLELKWRYFKNDSVFYGVENDVDLSPGHLYIMKKPIHLIEKKLGYICHQNGDLNSITIRLKYCAWNRTSEKCCVNSYGKCASVNYLLQIRNLINKNAGRPTSVIIADLIFEFLNLQWVLPKLKGAKKSKERLKQKKLMMDKNLKKQQEQEEEKHLKAKLDLAEICIVRQNQLKQQQQYYHVMNLISRNQAYRCGFGTENQGLVLYHQQQRDKQILEQNMMRQQLIQQQKKQKLFVVKQETDKMLFEQNMKRQQIIQLEQQQKLFSVKQEQDKRMFEQFMMQQQHVQQQQMQQQKLFSVKQEKDKMIFEQNTMQQQQKPLSVDDLKTKSKKYKPYQV